MKLMIAHDEWILYRQIMYMNTKIERNKTICDIRDQNPNDERVGKMLAINKNTERQNASCTRRHEIVSFFCFLMFSAVTCGVDTS